MTLRLEKLFLLLVLLPPLSLCNFVMASEAESLFQSGVKKYQEKNWIEAEETLEKALAAAPESVPALYNLALAEFQLEKWGEAIAHFKRAQYLSPSLGVAKDGIKLAEEKLENKSFTQELGLLKTLRRFVFTRLSSGFFAFLSIAALFFFGWVWILYSGERKRALENDELKPIPGASQIFATILLILFVWVSSLKFIDNLKVRGIVVAKETEAMSGPSSEKTALFNLYEGTEVLLKTIDEKWVQVSIPGGLTGWILQDNVIQTTGEKLW